MLSLRVFVVVGAALISCLTADLFQELHLRQSRRRATSPQIGERKLRYSTNGNSHS
jgi:hypothetical protein